jgi:ubiquitin carboxyl-terminal hydrolase 36/42
MFGIKMASVVKCDICQRSTVQENWEPIWAVSIDSRKVLVESLARFCEGERLCGDNAYHCLRCEGLVQATRSFHLIALSPIIFINMKRFAYDRQTKTTRKIKTFVSYPEFLDLNSYFDDTVRFLQEENEETRQSIYRLYAVVVHLGEQADNGHIFSYIRSPDGFWYEANDSSITPVNLERVLSDNGAYVLCYAKASDVTTISVNAIGSNNIRKTSEQVVVEKSLVR